MLHNRLVRRKWGYYLVLLNRKHFKVKLLWFRKSGQLSKQKHKKRSELWLFLKGAGIAYVDGERYSLSEGMGFLVKADMWHWYLATTRTLVLEIQYGDKCEESDIVRI